ncbi:carboxymuconolactone decarboxylase family protein [Aquiflexum sp.]|uniref:carboxymuconolactone decarboxylase family protein n=1 Tax=Aquiflexum sp. TaxID=1872584 RepID=UPI0035935647
MKNYKMKSPLVEMATADEVQKNLLDTAKKENKMIPNMYKAMANSPSLIDTYMHGYKKFRTEGVFSPAEQEVVFLTISAENQCTYCMGAHSLLADTVAKVPVEVTEAIRDNTEIPHEKFRVLSEFTSVMVNKRGLPSEDDVQKFLKAGYSEQHILSIILAISVKTISNYVNHVFDTELDGVFKAREWKGYKVTRDFVNFFRK